VDGAANAALVDFLSDTLGAARRDVVIEAGATSRHKRVSVAGARRPPEVLVGADYQPSNGSR